MGLRHGWLVYFIHDKQLLDEVFGISGMIKVEQQVLSAEPKAARLITLTATLII